MDSVFSKSSPGNNQTCDLLGDLVRLRQKRKDEDNILLEMRSVVRRHWLSKKNVLNHLDLYLQTDSLLDDEEIESDHIFTIEEIEKICVLYRMHFVDAVYFKGHIPTVVEIKLEYLNDTYKKKIGGLKILSYRNNFIKYNANEDFGVMFAPTLNGHYYLVHHWGKPVSKMRKYQYWPLRTFETLAISIILFTLFVDLILPTHLITLDRTAAYWSGYRLGVFFHLLIFFGGLTMFVVVGFFRNVSKNIWHTL